MNRIEEIRQRLAAIATEMDAEGADTNALLTEARALRDEMETLRSQENDRRELRGLIAGGEGRRMETGSQPILNNGVDSEIYHRAFLRNLMGQELTPEERGAISSADASGGAAIPTQTLDRVIENMVQIAPILGEIDLMHIPSNVTIAVEGTRNAAALHTENAVDSGSDDTLIKISLTGYEMMKLIPISAKMDGMAIPAFEQWLVSNLSRSLAELIENYVINGTGSSQPKGIDAAETWASGTNALTFAAVNPTLAELQTLIGTLNGAYIGNAKFLMNWKTFWGGVHALRDDKHPEVVTRENGQYYVFGFPVVISSKAVDGDIFFGDFREGVKANFAQDVTVEASRISGFRSNSVDYRGTCIFDSQTVAGRIVKGAKTL